MGIIIFNGISSSDLHILVQHPPEYVIPERDYTITHVPGRDGDIAVDNGGWLNVERTYNLAIDARFDGYSKVAGNVARWLHSSSGYARLEDSYEPEYYRMAMYKSQANISNIFMQAGEFDATFECKPQRFLKSGLRKLTLTNGSILRNPTLFNASPKIMVFGSGSGKFTIGNYSVEITNILDGMIVDCEMQDAYFGSTNCNGRIVLDDFPKILPESNPVTITGGITKLEVLPRWWTL